MSSFFPLLRHHQRPSVGVVVFDMGLHSVSTNGVYTTGLSLTNGVYSTRLSVTNGVYSTGLSPTNDDYDSADTLHLSGVCRNLARNVADAAIIWSKTGKTAPVADCVICALTLSVRQRFVPKKTQRC